MPGLAPGTSNSSGKAPHRSSITAYVPPMGLAEPCSVHAVVRPPALVLGLFKILIANSLAELKLLHDLDLDFVRDKFSYPGRDAIFGPYSPMPFDSIEPRCVQFKIISNIGSETSPKASGFQLQYISRIQTREHYINTHVRNAIAIGPCY